MAPLDEALVQVALDCSGRPHLSYSLAIPSQKIGTYDTELVKEFFVAVVNNSGLTLHVRQFLLDVDEGTGPVVAGIGASGSDGHGMAALGSPSSRNGL